MSEQLLQQILEELKDMKADMNGLKVEQQATNQRLDRMENRLTFVESNMATKQDIESIHKKLDVLTAQVAHNTEQEVVINELAATVDEHGTDIKLIKKLMTNQ